MLANLPRRRPSAGAKLEALYEKAAKGTSNDAVRIELLNEVALIAEEIIQNASKAIAYYERILAINPLYVPALDALEKLYEREGRHKQLAGLLEKRLHMSNDDESLDIKLALGRLYLDRLFDPPSAVGHLEDVSRRARPTLKHDSWSSACWRSATCACAPRGFWSTSTKLATRFDSWFGCSRIRREGATDEAERRGLLRRIAVLRDERLRDNRGAFASLAELVPLEPEDENARRRFIEIGRRIREHEAVASVLTQAADAEAAARARGDILMEVARIYEELLEDEDRAEQVYQRVIRIDAQDPGLVIPAAQALGRIYAAEAKHEALANTLAIEVRLEQDVEKRRSLFERIGSLYETVLDDPEKAIAAFRARLVDDPADLSALGALERLYERTGDYRETRACLAQA